MLMNVTFPAAQRVFDYFSLTLYKAVSTSAAFVFTMNTLPDRFMSATDPLSRRRFTKRVIVDAFGAVSPGYSTEMHLSSGNENL
ncbi:hypothetical protein TNCT_330841 [Trichonephila clavata]|uniref:Uncharacterized protein n=1 Tax=Trichonephila clavata TaxID=2740835 RepID=A0A8X6HKS2_TRICU|nr:hypothetical protein TNCT_330841 [Trichonephila clavata]